MTFSDAKLKKMVDAFFVCSWTDLEGTKGAGGSPRIKCGGTPVPQMRGSGYSNLQLCVYTPDLRLLHVVTGWISAGDLVWELSQALVTWDAVQAKPRTATNTVRRRQADIQRSYEGRPASKKKIPFQLATPTKRKWKQFAYGVSDRARRHSKKDRKVLTRFPYMPASKVTTERLTHRDSNGGFPGDGRVIDTSTMPGLDAVLARSAPMQGRRPPPWEEMSPERVQSIASALGVKAPKPAKTKRSKTKVRAS